MEKVITLEEALKRIEDLENENAELREELEYYKNRKLSGRQKHNGKWMTIYNDFIAGYESGMTMIEIARRNNVSERTIYRYKAYYDELKNKNEREGIQLQYNNFKGVEFDSFRNQAGSNAFTMSPTKWIETTGAIGIVCKSGRYGDTYAHADIAFELAS